MSTYPLVSSAACEDMRYPMSRCGDCPYHFYEPFYEENLFKESSSSLEIKDKNGTTQPSTNKTQQCSSKKSCPQRLPVESTQRTENCFKDSVSSLDTEINNKNARLSNNKQQQFSSRKPSPQRYSVAKTHRLENFLNYSGSSLDTKSAIGSKQASNSKLQQSFSRKSSPQRLSAATTPRTENSFEDSGSSLDTYSRNKTTQPSKNKQLQCYRRKSPQRLSVASTQRTENFYKDSGSSFDTKSINKTRQYSNNKLQQHSSRKSSPQRLSVASTQKAENFFQESGSSFDTKGVIETSQLSKHKLHQCSSRKPSPPRHSFANTLRTENFFQDSGSSLDTKSINVTKCSKNINMQQFSSRKSCPKRLPVLTTQRTKYPFKDSGSSLESKSENGTTHKNKLRCSSRELSPQRKEDFFKDSGCSLEIKDNRQPSNNQLLKRSSEKISSSVLSSQRPSPATQRPNVPAPLRPNSPNKQRSYSPISQRPYISSSRIFPAPVKTDHLGRPIKIPSLYTERKPSPRYLSHLSHHHNYHRLRKIHSFLDKLESDYPSICSTGSIGKSLEDRDLKMLRISNSNATNIAVWIDAGIHAREWIAPATATYLADYIAKNFNTLPGYMTNKDWYFLPVMNPDGYEYSHTKDRMWRKNMAWHKGQLIGVDLNRNFSYGWGGFGSSDEPTNVFYHGPFAFSEPESTAVRDMLLNSGTKFTVYLTLHSYGQVILFPFACKEELCPSYVRLLEGATIMSRAIYNTNGNTYKVGISRDVMYGAAGTSNDWSYGVAGIPYCYLLELRSKKHRFKVPSDEIEETGKEILSSIIALMEFVDNYTPMKVGTKKVLESDDEKKSIRSTYTRDSSSTNRSFRSMGKTR